MTDTAAPASHASATATAFTVILAVSFCHCINDIMQSLRMVVTQLLFPRIGGGRVACREFMIFDSATRNAFLGKDPDDWPALARKMMLGKRAVSRTLSESTYLAYRAGLLSQEHWHARVRADREAA